MASTKREKELARMRAERQTARRAEATAARRQRNTVLASTLAVVLVIAVVAVIVLQARGSKKTTTTPAATNTPTPGASATATPSGSAAPSAPPVAQRPVACGATAPPPPVTKTFPTVPPLTIDKAATYTETIKTSCGVITAKLLADKAPQTVNSFEFLAGQKFFNGALFSRSTGTGAGLSVLQGGDQEGSGAGGPGYKLPDENLAGATYSRGTLAMANGGPGTGGSQFFLVAADSQLAPNYTVFGQITGGLDVLDKIMAIGDDGSNQAGGGAPLQRVYIEDLTVAKG